MYIVKKPIHLYILILISLQKFSLRELFTVQGPVTKPEVIERVDGYVKEVSEWKTYKYAKEAMVKLSDGATVSVYIPPPVVVHKGEKFNISVMAVGDSSRFYVYKKHLTSKATGAH